MKTVKMGDEIKRVEDSEAMVLITKGWAYCKKELWKAIRDKDKKPVKKAEYKKVRKVEDVEDVEETAAHDISNVDKNDSSAEIMAKDHRVENDGLAKYKAKKARKKGAL